MTKAQQGLELFAELRRRVLRLKEVEAFLICSLSPLR